MKIRIIAGSINLSIPVPLRMAGFAIRNMPESLFLELRKKVSAPHDRLICRENLLFFYEACRDDLLAHQGLEIIHVEQRDGTFVSVVL